MENATYSIEDILYYKNKATINVRVANIIANLIANRKIDVSGREYYTYNGKEYYFTNDLGQYAGAYADYRADFKESLNFQNNINMSNYNIAMNNTISYNDSIIRSYSPTLLEQKHLTLYNAVLEEVHNGKLGGKRISKGKSNKVAKKPVVSQTKQSVYKEIFGKQMKIYKMPDSRKEYVKYKGELHPISEYKSLMKQKAMAKPKAKK